MLPESEELVEEKANPSKRSLFLGDFSEDLNCLSQLGACFERDFILSIQDKEILEDEIKLKKERYRYIQIRIDDEPFHDDSESLNTRLQHLLCLTVAWEDPGLRTEINVPARLGDKETEAPKKIRQSIKLKKDIDKSIRHAIHIGLMLETARIRSEATRIANETNGNNKLKRNFENDLESNKRPNPFDKIEISSLEEKKPYEILEECINSINGETPKDIEQIFKKAANAISSFKSRPDKFLYILGVLIAFLAALACGLTVGGCAYLLFMGLTPVTFFLVPLIPAIILSSIGALTVFGVNFYFLYKSIPEILLSAAKMGGITEYINPEGKRVQLSRFKKILLLPAAVVSFAVGVSMIAFTARNFIRILAGVIPALALSIATPFLPILLGTLMVGLGMALSILMFKGFVWLLQKPLLELAKQAFDYMKNLSFLGWLGLGLKLLVCGLSMVGLYTLYFAGIPTLMPFFGPAAVLIGWASFLGEIPFTLMMVSQLCDLAGNFLANSARKVFNFCFARQNAEEKVEGNSSQEKTSFKLKLLVTLFIIFITINALMNALLVIGAASILALVAVAACFINSFASNLIVPDRELENRRNQANDACLQVFKTNTTKKEVPCDVLIPITRSDILANDCRSASCPSLFFVPQNEKINSYHASSNNSIDQIRPYSSGYTGL